MSDGNKLKEVMCDGEWWSLKDLSKAIKKSKEETKARIVELIKAGELKIQGKTKDRVYRLQKAVRVETLLNENAKAQVPVVTGRLKAAAPKPKAKPKARPAPPPPVHEHEWHASEDGYRKCATCGREEYQVKGEWFEAPVYRHPSRPDEGAPALQAEAYDVVTKRGKIVTMKKVPVKTMEVDVGYAVVPASPPEAEGNYCIQCGIEILQRERCDECAQHPIAVGKVAILCPTCKAPAIIEWKQGTSHVELTGKCERCGLFQTALELPPLTPPPR